MATLPQWIEARVIQKIATEAEWNEITLVPYKGEVCLVGDSGGKVVNIKIGDGVNTFPNLEYMFDSIQQNVGYIAIESNALPTPEGDVAWGMVTGGAYTFGGSTAFTVPDGHWGIANYSSGAWSLVDMGELPTYEPSEEFNDTNEEAVKGNVIYDGTIKPVDLTIEQARTNQLYNKEVSLKHSSMSTAGVITTGNPGGVYDTGLVSDKIPTKEGETHVTISGTQGEGLKYIIFFNSSDAKVGTTGEFTNSPYTRAIVANSSYFRVYINSRFDPPAYEDLFMVNWGESALPVEPYYDEKITKIKGINVGSDVDLTPYATNSSLTALSESVNEALMDMDEKISSQGYVDNRYINQFHYLASVHLIVLI